MTRVAAALAAFLVACPAAAAGPRIVVVHADEPDAVTELGVRSLELKLRGGDPSGARSFEIDAALEGDRHLTLTGRTNPLPERQFPVSDGQVVLRGGELRRFSLLPAVWNALVDRIPLVPIPRVPTSVGHPSLLHELRASFVVQDGALHTEDLAVVTDDWHARGAGWVGLDGRLDVRNEVTLTQEGIEQMLVMATLPLPKTGLLSLPGIPVRIGGTVGEPEIQVDAARVPLAPLHILFGIGRALPRLLLPGRGKP